jgi:ABC-type transporter MlaC component
MVKIDKNKAIELMSQTNGKTFSAIFTKKDGSERHMNCRTGVSKGVKGVGLSYDAASKGLFKVYDMQSKGFRMININTIKALQINKEFYVVVE